MASAALRGQNAAPMEANLLLRNPERNDNAIMEALCECGGGRRDSSVIAPSGLTSPEVKWTWRAGSALPSSFLRPESKRLDCASHSKHVQCSRQLHSPTPPAPTTTTRPPLTHFLWGWNTRTEA